MSSGDLNFLAESLCSKLGGMEFEHQLLPVSSICGSADSYGQTWFRCDEVTLFKNNNGFPISYTTI